MGGRKERCSDAAANLYLGGGGWVYLTGPDRSAVAYARGLVEAMWGEYQEGYPSARRGGGGYTGVRYLRHLGDGEGVVDGRWGKMG
jgi:hypothetical protein